MSIHLVFITHNRLHYTKSALASVLADSKEAFKLTICDNASSDGTVEYLKNEVSDARIDDIIFSRENIGQTEAVNRVWSSSGHALLGKLDNDCIVTPGWTTPLTRAHAQIEKLGVIACWPFFADDFDYRRCRHKIQRFGRHWILRHPWTCGTGFLIKNETFRKFGPIEKKSMTGYWLKIASAGYVNGFYYPLIYQEHMDDPVSSHCTITDDESFRRATAFTAGLRGGRYETVEGRLKWREEVVRNLLDDPYEPQYYRNWRKKWRALKARCRRLNGSVSKAGGL